MSKEAMKCNKCGDDWSNSGDSAHICGPVKVKKQEQGGWHTHYLYADADKDRPDVICDRNGQVVLDLCKRCGRAEAELETPCDKAEQEQSAQHVGEPLFKSIIEKHEGLAEELAAMDKEPVAWYIREKDMLTRDANWVAEYQDMCEPLYTTPQQRKPLTDEQADSIIDGLRTCLHRDSKRDFLKTWLRDWAAHGIKE